MADLDCTTGDTGKLELPSEPLEQKENISFLSAITDVPLDEPLLKQKGEKPNDSFRLSEPAPPDIQILEFLDLDWN